MNNSYVFEQGRVFVYLTVPISADENVSEQCDIAATGGNTSSVD